MGFDEEFDEELELDEDLDEEMDQIPGKEINSKTPAGKAVPEGKKISVYFNSLIGPEKKQKLLVNSGNLVGDIKETVANLFGLDPDDYF